MNALIIYNSGTYGNTEKIAKAMAETLKTSAVKPPEVDTKTMNDYDLIGFGSGIYLKKHHESIFDLVEKLPMVDHKKAFVFSTSGEGTSDYHTILKDKLQQKGFDVLDDFSCKGFETWERVKTIGGSGRNVGKPDEQDIKNAQQFVLKLKKKYDIQ